MFMLAENCSNLLAVTLAAGIQLGPYKILAAIGAGGMGEVYRARDTRLGRDVAIKVLPPAFASDPDRLRRFEQEARAASALNHPNIVVIHDVGAQEGLPYLVEELLEGESLRERLRQGALPVHNAVGIAVQITHGLAAAHEKGIVHRDLKPENVFLTRDGQVKILDFGLAKLIEGAQSLESTAEMSTLADQTGTGPVLGTLGYMSPEQVRGQPVDHRTDIFALGCVLHEMLSGKRAFPGETPADTVSAILGRDPAPIGESGRGVPPALHGVLRRCLEKRPPDRFSSAHDLTLALSVISETLLVGPAPVEPTVKSIVVLPFENLSPDPDNAFFADGLTEELIADLSAVRALRVISRTSAMLLKSSKKDVPTISRELNVRYVLEGSVRRAGNGLRITAQLIDAGNDAHLWAEKYNGTLDDVFAIQERVSAAIVTALKLQLTPTEAGRLTEHPIPNALAFEFYLKARQEILKWTGAGLDRALKYLHSGLELAGPNAVLFAGLAYVHLQYLNLGLRKHDDCRREAQSWLDKAFALEPECPQAHFVLGALRFAEKPAEAIRHLMRVLEQNPDDFDAIYFLCCLLGSLGQTEVVVPLEERAAQLDPLSPAGHIHLGFNRLWEGKFEKAREILGRLHREFPADPVTKFTYGLSLAYLGEGDRAVGVFDELAREQPGTIFSVLGLSFSYGLAGKRSEVLSCLDTGLRIQLRMDFQYACWVAECYALIDEREAALDWLERDVDLGMINYPFLNQYDPFFARLRGDPRFEKLTARVKVEWENFKI